MSGVVGGKVIGTVSTSSGEYAIRIDEGATYTYFGFANPGSAEGDAVWKIKRLTNASDTIVFADGDSDFDNSWTARASLTYS
jgi:hypothetical protein